MKNFNHLKTIESLGLFLVYLFVGSAAYYISWLIRFDGLIPERLREESLRILPLIVAMQLIALVVSKQFSVLSGYYSLVEFKIQSVFLTLTTFITFAIAWLFGLRVPRGIWIIDAFLVVFGLACFRLAIRRRGSLRRIIMSLRIRELSGESDAVAIVGAGDVGSALILDLFRDPGLKMKPIVIFDDDQQKWNKHLHGVRIVGRPEMLLESPWKQVIKRIILAIPNASGSRIREVAAIASKVGIPSETVPSVAEILSGRVKISKIRPIEIIDLLRRPTIILDTLDVANSIQGKVVAVTGAGGSIGSELCRQIVDKKPDKILLIDHSEFLLFQIEQEINKKGLNVIVVPLLADVCDSSRLREIFGQHRPNAVFHAAAYKHVPLIESQPGAGIRNNTFGSINVIRISNEFLVDRFVMISTDKAINPTNAMGATKRMAELFLQAFQSSSSVHTRYMAVRFGNVLGSSGSVVPMFQRQIAAGGPVTVTHPEVTRYFMTIPEAVGLVLQAGTLGLGGEIFVLDMGQPVKILNLANQMIELAGLRPDIDIKVVYTGLRPGEKMYEELSHGMEFLENTKHSKIFRFVSSPIDLNTFEQQLQWLDALLFNADANDIKLAIQKILPEYTPDLRG